jgi:hypothetical protein
VGGKKAIDLAWGFLGARAHHRIDGNRTCASLGLGWLYYTNKPVVSVNPDCDSYSRDGVALNFSPRLFGVNQRYVNHQLWRRCLSRAKHRHAGYSSSSTPTQTAYTVQSGNP